MNMECTSDNISGSNSNTLSHILRIINHVWPQVDYDDCLLWLPVVATESSNKTPSIIITYKLSVISSEHRERDGADGRERGSKVLQKCVMEQLDSKQVNDY